MTDSGPAIPVILDTDIGTDIDDTWALAMLLKSPELDFKLAVAGTGDAVYRARILARLLEAAGRTDIPIGVGICEANDGPKQPQASWVEGYELQSYPGVVHQDGVGAMKQALSEADAPVTIIGIGPLTDVASALRYEDGLARKHRFAGMQGSIRSGHQNIDQPEAEYNVKSNVRACRDVFSAEWERCSIAPLDTCARVKLDGERYARLRDGSDPLLQAVIENYRAWAADKDDVDPEASSTALFDTLAVYLAFATDHLKIETLKLKVNDQGYTVPDEAGNALQVATEWTDLPAYHEFLAKRLLGATVRPG